MRVLQVITDTDRRGAQVFACDLGRALAEMGHTADTVALTAGTTPSPLPMSVLGKRRRGVRTILALRRRMREYDVTIAHGSATLLACALSGRPFVYRQISDSRFWAAGWIRRLRVAAYMRRSHHVVALSETAATTLVEHLWVAGDRITVIPNGVPGSNFSPIQHDERAAARKQFGISDDAFVLLYIGALVPEKGVDVVIRAVANLRGAMLVVAGGGPEDSSLQRLASELRSPTMFLGVLADSRVAYSIADVNVLASRGGDSMPATLIEAGMCGLPSVGTPVGAITEVILEGVTGRIVPCDDVASLREAVERMRSDDRARETFAAAARRHCMANFDIKEVASRWLKVLEKVHSAR